MTATRREGPISAENETMRFSSVAALFVLLVALLNITAWAHGAAPAQIVENFHKALVAGDREAALALLLQEWEAR
jgi:hypothetical protein